MGTLWNNSPAGGPVTLGSNTTSNLTYGRRINLCTTDYFPVGSNANWFQSGDQPAYLNLFYQGTGRFLFPVLGDDTWMDSEEGPLFEILWSAGSAGLEDRSFNLEINWHDCYFDNVMPDPSNVQTANMQLTSSGDDSTRIQYDSTVFPGSLNNNSLNYFEAKPSSSQPDPADRLDNLRIYYMGIVPVADKLRASALT